MHFGNMRLRDADSSDDQCRTICRHVPSCHRCLPRLTHAHGKLDLKICVLVLLTCIQGWASNNLAPHYVRAVGIGMVISIANCSAFIGTFIYLQRDAPRYVLGHSVSLGALVITIVLSAAQCVYLGWENKKRDRGERDDRLLQADADRLGHQHPSFRFTL